MYSAFPTKISRLAVSAFFIYVSLFTLVLGIMMSHLSRRWIVSDWLINYQGGFVRRGLAGEIAFLLGRLAHVSPVVLVTVFYLSFFFIFLFSMRYLALGTSLNAWVLAMIVNPATFSFQILHPTAGFRKEIIFLAGLSLFVVLLQKKKLSPVAIAVYLTAWIVFGILSHEAITFFVPYFFAALLLSGCTFWQAVRQFAVPAVAGLGAFYLCSTHLGTRDTAMQICSSLGYKFVVPGSLEICSGGAIPYLMRSREFARAETVATIRNYHFMTIFPAFALLALIPAIGESVAMVRAGMGRKVTILWGMATISFLGSLALFAYGIDWGRWIYVHLCSIAILLFLIDASAQQTCNADSEKASPSALKAPPMIIAALFLYATCWLLPNTYEMLHWGYIERVGRVLHIWPRSNVPDIDPSNLS